MFRGITSIDTAFEIAGIIQAGNLMRFLFIDTFIGKMALLVSCLLSIKESLVTQDLKKSVFYILILLGVWSFILMPMTIIGKAYYSVETGLIKESKIEEILEHRQYVTEKGPLFLNVFSQMMMIFIKGSIVAIDSFRHDGCSYLKQPMEKAILFSELYDVLRLGIGERDLREKIRIFYQDVFFPVIQKTKINSLKKNHFLWPWDEQAAKAYTLEQKKIWEMIANEILKNVNSYENILERMNHMYKSYKNSLEKMILEEILKQEFQTRPEQYIFKSWETLKKKEILNKEALKKDSFFWKSFVERCFWFQGILLFYGYAIFPIVLLIAIIIKKYMWIGAYFLGLFWIRFLNVIWAMIDQTNAFLLNVAIQQEKVSFEKMIHINEGTFVAMIIAPIMMWILISWILKEKIK